MNPASFFVNEADTPALRTLLAKLARSGYSEMQVRERLGLSDIAALNWRGLPIYRDERLKRRDPLDLAIDLFLLQGTLGSEELGRLFNPSEQDLLIRLGLVAIDGAGLARVSLFPIGNRLIFSDHAWPELPHPGYAQVPRDHVMALGPDSHDLARCTARRRVQASLDLCTGSGVHALLAAAHSERVLAVDTSARAARCARFNAWASAAANVEVAEGDLFEPARGQRFDLITANPPFVVSPVNTLAFRDGGRSGEDVQKRIVAGLPHHLAPGGIAHIVTELGERPGEPLTGRLRAWLHHSPIDIHLLRLREFSSEKYSTGHAKGDTYAGFLDSVGAWAGNLREQSYSHVVSVLISFQWTDPSCGPPWERVDVAPPPLRDAGAEIDSIFLAERMARKPDLRQILERSWLRRGGPIALLDARAMGSEIPATAKATRLGQALQMEHPLDALEREILIRMDAPIAGSELLSISGRIDVLEAIRSLLRNRLVFID